MYFNNFSRVWYDLEDNKKYELVTNILQRVAFRKRLKDEGDFFIEYTAKDTDKPEIIADKIYGDSNFHWIVLMFNDIINPLQEWVKTPQALSDFFDKKYIGTTLFLDSSDYVYKTTDRVSIDRYDDQNNEWIHIGEGTVSETDKSFHKVVIKEKDIDAQIGDYLTLDAVANADGVDIPSEPATYNSVNPNSPQAATNGAGDTTGSRLACKSCKKLDVWIHSNDDFPPPPDGAPICSVDVKINIEETARCVTISGPRPATTVRRIPDIGNDPFHRCSLRVSIELCSYDDTADACDCELEDILVEANDTIWNVSLADDDGNCAADCGPGSPAHMLLGTILNDMSSVGMLVDCCSKSKTPMGSRFVPNSYTLKKDELLWWGIKKSILSEALVDAGAGYKGSFTVDDTMRTDGGETNTSYDYVNPPEGLVVIPREILKIVLEPEKAVHHFEDADGNVLNPLADLEGNTYSGTINQPYPINWKDTLLFAYTQDNQIIDSETISAISFEENVLEENESRRSIKLLRPEYLDIAVQEFEDLLGE